MDLKYELSEDWGGGGGHNWEQAENEPEMYSCWP